MPHLRPELPFFLWKTVSALYLACVCIHAHAFPYSSQGLPGWAATITYLTLCLVFLCWTSNYVDLWWRQSQDIVNRNIFHGTICSTDFDVALKKIILLPKLMLWLLNSMHYKDGTSFALRQQTNSLLINAVNHTQLKLFACMPAELQICVEERISSSSIYL